MKVTSCRFDRAAYGPTDEPRPHDPLIVFAGRSNVGKSSLINRLLGVRSLARTSTTPGRTQSVNFYRVNESLYFVDLPGYGYARVPEQVRRTWGPMIEGFLGRQHDVIALAVLVVDARHEVGSLDVTMKEWIEHRRIAYVVAATKSDKLSGNTRRTAARRLHQGLGKLNGGAGPLLVSARTGLGIRELWRELDRALHDARERRAGSQRGRREPR